MDEPPVPEVPPPRAVDFEVRPIRPRGRSGPGVARAWVAGLVALVGVGILAEDPTQGRRTFADDAREPPGVVELPEARPSQDRIDLAVVDVVDLQSPAPARVEVTTPQVHVAGLVLVRAASVEISLEARGNRVLDHVSVDTASMGGRVRPIRPPSFSASFDLPYPRPNGTMWVVVTAYDERGIPLGGTRRPFIVGPLLDPEPTPGTEVGDGGL